MLQAIRTRDKVLRQLGCALAPDWHILCVCSFSMHCLWLFCAFPLEGQAISGEAVMAGCAAGTTCIHLNTGVLWEHPRDLPDRRQTAGTSG